MATDFSQGKVWHNIVSQAIPLILAQLVQILYNVVDRIYIGHLPGENNIALTGVGLAFPVVTLILAFICYYKGKAGRAAGRENHGQCFFPVIDFLRCDDDHLLFVLQTHSVSVWSQ